MPLNSISISNFLRAFKINSLTVIDCPVAKTITEVVHEEPMRDIEHYCGAYREYWTNVKGCEGDSGSIEIHFIDEVNPGYFWIFPVNDGTVNVGIGMVISEQRKQHGIKKSLKKMQKNVIENHPIFKERFVGAKLVEGTENEKGIDIQTLRAKTGLITYDPGYKNTGSCKSSLTFLNGEEGILRYRGYSIDELCSKSSFIEVSYLLIYGELPNKDELSSFVNEIKQESIVDEDLKSILKSFPKSAHPMGVLASLTSGLIAFNPSSVDVDSDHEMREAIVMLLAKFPILS